MRQAVRVGRQILLPRIRSEGTWCGATAYKWVFPVGSFSVEKSNQWNDLAFRTLLCGLQHYFIGEKSVDRMYVRSIFSTSLLACSDLIAS
jgi:hypothetical protein